MEPAKEGTRVNGRRFFEKREIEYDLAFELSSQKMIDLHKVEGVDNACFVNRYGVKVLVGLCFDMLAVQKRVTAWLERQDTDPRYNYHAFMAQSIAALAWMPEERDNVFRGLFPQAESRPSTLSSANKVGGFKIAGLFIDDDLPTYTDGINQLCKRLAKQHLDRVNAAAAWPFRYTMGVDMASPNQPDSVCIFRTTYGPNPIMEYLGRGGKGINVLEEFRKQWHDEILSKRPTLSEQWDNKIKPFTKPELVCNGFEVFRHGVDPLKYVLRVGPLPLGFNTFLTANPRPTYLELLTRVHRAFAGHPYLSACYPPDRHYMTLTLRFNEGDTLETRRSVMAGILNQISLAPDLPAGSESKDVAGTFGAPLNDAEAVARGMDFGLHTHPAGRKEAQAGQVGEQPKENHTVPANESGPHDHQSRPPATNDDGKCGNESELVNTKAPRKVTSIATRKNARVIIGVSEEHRLVVLVDKAGIPAKIKTDFIDVLSPTKVSKQAFALLEGDTVAHTHMLAMRLMELYRKAPGIHGSSPYWTSKEQHEQGVNPDLKSNLSNYIMEGAGTVRYEAIYQFNGPAPIPAPQPAPRYVVVKIEFLNNHGTFGMYRVTATVVSGPAFSKETLQRAFTKPNYFASPFPGACSHLHAIKASGLDFVLPPSGQQNTLSFMVDLEVPYQNTADVVKIAEMVANRLKKFGPRSDEQDSYDMVAGTVSHGTKVAK